MPPKRPAPLSDKAINPQDMPSSLGLTNQGVPLRVKNTFIDVASEPSSVRGARELLTAPADLSQSLGFMQRSLACASQHAPPSEASPLRWVPGCVATPSPTDGAGVFHDFSSLASAAPGGILAPQTAIFGSQVISLNASTLPASSISLAPAHALGLVMPPSSLPPSSLPQPVQTSLPPPSSCVRRLFDVNRRVPDASEDDDEEDEEEALQAQQQQQVHPGHAPTEPPPGAQHPSLGSEGHNDSTCKRCCFYPRGRCLNGYDCQFCHYDHEKRKRKNKKKKKKDGSGGNAAEDSVAPSETSGAGDSRRPSKVLGVQPPVPPPPIFAPNLVQPAMQAPPQGQPMMQVVAQPMGQTGVGVQMSSGQAGLQLTSTSPVQGGPQPLHIAGTLLPMSGPTTATSHQVCGSFTPSYPSAQGNQMLPPPQASPKFQQMFDLNSTLQPPPMCPNVQGVHMFCGPSMPAPLLSPKLPRSVAEALNARAAAPCPTG